VYNGRGINDDMVPKKINLPIIIAFYKKLIVFCDHNRFLYFSEIKSPASVYYVMMIRPYESYATLLLFHIQPSKIFT